MALTGTIFGDDAANDALYVSPRVTGGSLLVEVGQGAPNALAFTNVVPASGSQLSGAAAAITFTVVTTSSSGGALPFTLWVKFRSESRRFLVYDSFLGFSYPFDTSTRVVDAFSVTQRGGWQDDVEAFCIGGVA